MESEQGVGHAPCYGCFEREIGCHSECRRYIAWKRKVDDDRKARQTAEEALYRSRNNRFFDMVKRHRNRTAQFHRKGTSD